MGQQGVEGPWGRVPGRNRVRGRQREADLFLRLPPETQGFLMGQAGGSRETLGPCLRQD